MAHKHTSFPAHGSALVTVLTLWNGHIISASDDHSIRIHTPDARLVRSLEGHTDGVWAIACAGDSLVSCAADRTTRVWDLPTGRCTHVFRLHTSTVRCVAIAEPEDGAGERPLIVTGSRDTTLGVCALPAPGDPAHTADSGGREDAHANPYFRLRCEGHEGPVRAVAARGRTAASASYDCTVRVWDLGTGACVWVLAGHTEKVYSVAIDRARARVCSSGMDGTVRVWGLADGACTHTLARHESLVGLMALSPAALVSAGAEGLVCVWDPASWALVHTVQHKGAVTAIAHDDTTVVSGSDGLVTVLDLKSGAVRDLLTDASRFIAGVAFAGSMFVAATRKDGDASYIDVWDFGAED